MLNITKSTFEALVINVSLRYALIYYYKCVTYELLFLLRYVSYEKVTLTIRFQFCYNTNEQAFSYITVKEMFI
jgi:hypothetical protein